MWGTKPCRTLKEESFAVVRKAISQYMSLTVIILKDIMDKNYNQDFFSLSSQDTDLPGAPENLTFRERQRLFSQGQDVSNKVKASRKLMELENELNTK